MSAQAQTVASVARRGYLDGWNDGELLARQVVKLLEELGELASTIETDDPAMAGYLAPISYLQVDRLRGRLGCHGTRSGRARFGVRCQPKGAGRRGEGSTAQWQLSRCASPPTSTCARSRTARRQSPRSSMPAQLSTLTRRAALTAGYPSRSSTAGSVASCSRRWNERP